MKDLFSLIALVALAGMIIAVGVKAGDTDTVTGTVTVRNFAISIEPTETSFDYGVMANNSASSTMTLFPAGEGITANNDGSKANFDIYGNHTGTGAAGTGWDLDTATSTEDHYMHKFCNETDDNCAVSGVFGADFTALTTNPATLYEDVVGESGTVDFQLSIHTPNPSTKYTQQSAVVTVQASEPTTP